MVIMITEVSAGGGVNTGGLVDPDGEGDGVGRPVLITDGGGLLSSTISNDKSLLL